jgi:TRAP-type C4-dicarboxylate transport system substrate-binding protein
MAVVFGLAAPSERAAAADAGKTYVMKMSLATINDTQHEWVKMFVAAVEKDSGGRIKGQIYPASQLGSIPRQIEGVQFGAIQGWVGPPEFLSGVDERFEVMSAPGLFTSLAQAGRIAAKPEVKDMVLGFGRDKGLLGISLFPYGASSVATRKPVHHLADFKGLKLRVLASPFQNELISRLGATPVAMTLGDVLPAIQQGTIDGSVSAMPVFTTMHYKDAAKYVVEIGQPFIFSVAEMSKKWFDTLPPDLQKIIVDEGQKNATAIAPWVQTFFAAQRKAWTDEGGELTTLPPDEQATMMARLSSIGDDMSKTRPALNRAFKTLAAAVKRDQ